MPLSFFWSPASREAPAHHIYGPENQDAEGDYDNHMLSESASVYEALLEFPLSSSPSSSSSSSLSSSFPATSSRAVYKSCLNSKSVSFFSLAHHHGHTQSRPAGRKLVKDPSGSARPSASLEISSICDDREGSSRQKRQRNVEGEYSDAGRYKRVTEWTMGRWKELCKKSRD